MFFPLIEIASRYKKNSNSKAVSNQSILSAFLSLKFKTTPTFQSATSYDEHVKAARALTNTESPDYQLSSFSSQQHQVGDDESSSSSSLYYQNEFELPLKQQRDHSFKSYFSDFYPLGSELDYIEANKQIYTAFNHYPQFFDDDTLSWYFSLSEKDKYYFEVIPSKIGLIEFGFAIAAKYPNHRNSPSIIGKFTKQQSVKGGDIAYSCKLDTVGQCVKFYLNGKVVFKQPLTYSTQPAPGTRLYFVPIVKCKGSYFLNIGQSPCYYQFKNSKAILSPPQLLHRRCDVLTDLLFKELIPSLENQSKHQQQQQQQQHQQQYFNTSSTSTSTPTNDYLKQVLNDVQPVFMELLYQSLVDYNIEDILISKLCIYLLGNDRYTDRLVDLILEFYSNETSTTLIQKIFNAISLKCRPTDLLDIKPYHLFLQLLHNERLANIFYSHPNRLLILDQVFSRGQVESITSFLIHKVDVANDKQRMVDYKTAIDKFNVEKTKANKQLFEFLINQYQTHNEPLVFDWIKSIIANEVNFSKNYLGGRKAEEYCYPFLFYIFTLIAEYLDAWMKAPFTIHLFPTDNLLFDPKWNEAEFDRLGGLFSHLISQSPSTIPSTLDSDHEKSIYEKLFTLGSLLLNLSFSKQISRINMDILSPYLLESISLKILLTF